MTLINFVLEETIHLTFKCSVDDYVYNRPKETMNSTATAASKRIERASQHKARFQETQKDTRTTWILHSSPWSQILLLLTLDLWEAGSACRISFPEEASLKKCCLRSWSSLRAGNLKYYRREIYTNAPCIAGSSVAYWCQSDRQLQIL